MPTTQEEALPAMEMNLAEERTALRLGFFGFKMAVAVALGCLKAKAKWPKEEDEGSVGGKYKASSARESRRHAYAGRGG